MENWNSANTDLFYGSAGTLPGSDKEHQEVSMLSLHLLQAALVYVNTIMVQHVLAEDDWSARLAAPDRRALTPLFWSHVNLYGKLSLEMDRHLDLDLPSAA